MIRGLSLFGFLAVFSVPAMATPFPDLGTRVEVPSVRAGQTSTQDLFSCPPSLRSAYATSGLPVGDSVQTVRAIDKKVRRTLRYRQDPRGSDVWTNFAAQVLGGHRATADCEDFATTAVTLAICAGVPAQKLGIALSNNRNSRADMRAINHAFAFYLDERGPVSVADTSASSPRSVTQRRDGVMLWQTVQSLLVTPAVFRASVNPPQTSLSRKR